MVADKLFRKICRKLYYPFRNTVSVSQLVGSENTVRPKNALYKPLVAYDISLLQQLVGDNTQAIREIVEKFIRDIPQEVDLLDQAVTEYNLSGMAVQAHKLKSNLKLFGLSSIVTELNAIEEMGKGRIPVEEQEVLHHYVKQIRVVFGRAVEDLSQAFPPQ